MTNNNFENFSENREKVENFSLTINEKDCTFPEKILLSISNGYMKNLLLKREISNLSYDATIENNKLYSVTVNFEYEGCNATLMFLQNNLLFKIKKEEKENMNTIEIKKEDNIENLLEKAFLLFDEDGKNEDDEFFEEEDYSDIEDLFDEENDVNEVGEISSKEIEEQPQKEEVKVLSEENNLSDKKEKLSVWKIISMILICLPLVLTIILIIYSSITKKQVNPIGLVICLVMIGAGVLINGIRKE